MFYGRVDVYWPDGPVESYRLHKPITAVGRSTGNDIVLDTTSISRYHITLSFQEQYVLLDDLESANGTYVDSVRLAPHTPYVLRGGEEIQIGDIRLIFHAPVEEATLLGQADTTQHLVLSQPTYQLELEELEMAVAPGAHVQALLKIENMGTEQDRYFIEVDGLPRSWVRIDRVELELQPGDQGQALISFKPLRRSESLPGEYPFVVRVHSKSRPAETIDAPTSLSVLPYSGFGLALGTPQLKDKGEFLLYIHNQGNAPLPVTVQGTDPKRRFWFRLAKESFRLEPGERQTLTGTVRLRQRRLFGAQREREFVLMARAQDASGFLAAVPGIYYEKGLLPSWMMIVAALPVLALIALFIGLLVLVIQGEDEKSPPEVQPVIEMFTAEHATITLGDALAVNWQVADAEQVELLIEHGGVQQRSFLNTSPVMLPFDHTGRYTLVLEAHNAALVSTATVAVEVRPVVALRLTVLDGTELVRHVQQDVQIEWDTRGVREFDSGYSVWLESPNQAEPLLSAPLTLSGQQVVSVQPTSEQAEWLVVLYAEGQDNVVASMTQGLAIVYPSCELSVPQTVVRSGPDLAYLAVVSPLTSSAEGNVSLSPTARDPSGAWLQVSIGIDNPQIGWVLRDDLTCTNFDPDHLITTDDFPPLPTATPTAIPTETPAAEPPTPVKITPTLAATPSLASSSP